MYDLGVNTFLFQSLFSYLKNVDRNSIYMIKLLWRVKELMNKAQYMPCGQYLVPFD